MKSDAQYIRVRWAEVDAQGVVFNPSYFMYADVAVTEYMRSAGLLAENDGEFSELFVVDAHATFHKSAKFDDMLQMKVNTKKIGKSSHSIQVLIIKKQDVLTTVDLIYVRVVNGQATPLSKKYRKMIEVAEEC